MAQLDKTFPTNDCAMCILAPKMIECRQHENVRLLSYSEVIRVRGNPGNFKIRVRKKARYVDEDKCTGCGVCITKCPWKVDSEFDEGMGKRKAIYIPFPQAIPNVPVIDTEHCAYFLKGTCRACERFCEAKAIDFKQKDKIVNIEVGAIILATGFELYDPARVEEYGYGRIKNVITAMQYERMVSASGPTDGELRRPSDGKRPASIAFIQCVGSRDIGHRLYCSSVCCMHATKEAILANEHYSDLKPCIFYTDLQAVGKRFQEYVARARQEYNVTYVRSRPSKITENKDTESPIIWYEETTTREIKHLEVDIAVLCQAMIPSHTSRETVNILGVNLDDYQFINIPDRLSHPVDTEIPGIFACGFCQSPQDIPDSVVQASAAAARAAEFLTGEDK